VGQSVPYTSDQLAPEFQKVLYKGGRDGIFLQPDPIGFLGGDINLYNYVANNPIMWIDPYGLLNFNPNLLGAGAALAGAGAAQAAAGAAILGSGNPIGALPLAIGIGKILGGGYMGGAALGYDPLNLFPGMVPGDPGSGTSDPCP
jgi:RHS repeat-associated protein